MSCKNKVSKTSPVKGATGELSFLQGQLSVLTLISVSVPSLCYRQSTKNIPVIVPKVQVARYS